ncbi:MAG: DUF5107 domain-containing protein [Clostridia bacterium]|nr:DUF5107 domain-containing protein [Clostridia bacterium]
MIKVETMKIMGSPIGSLNPMPILRDLNPHKPVDVHPELSQSLKETLGHHCGFRVLPYKVQDGYKNELIEMEIKTVVLENKYLKATFLPEYGGRLYALYHKVQKRELLTVNPIFRPRNLALRNAWFSGGIEWNMAHFGHSFLTCDDVYFAVIEHGEDLVLRMYEYERCKGLFYQIDFHLPNHQDQLICYTKIFNIKDKEIPLYYWSNVAVPAMEKTRIFSSTDRVLYIQPYLDATGNLINTFNDGTLPTLNNWMEDASYPESFKHSNEYFYQISKDEKYPWQGVGYKEGFLFYEFSTRPLAYRKMFCWGTHKGGEKWQSYLTLPSEDAYLEIQAGLFPSQMHQEMILPKQVIEFMQVFGCENVAPNQLYCDLQTSSEAVKQVIFNKNNSDTIAAFENKAKLISKLPVTQILHEGQPYGKVALKKAKKTIPTMDFTHSKEEKVKILLDLLDQKSIQTDVKRKIYPFYVDSDWEEIFSGSEDYYAKWMLALSYYEDLKPHRALRMLEEMEKNTITYGTLGDIYFKLEKYEEAKEALELGLNLMDEIELEGYKERYLVLYFKVLKALNEWQKAYEIGHAYTKTDYEPLYVLLVEILLENGDHEKAADMLLFNPVQLREGDNTLVELWYRLEAIKANKSIDWIKKHKEPPFAIDFRMA